MCASWPHACITSTSLPSASVCGFVAAQGRPVVSRTPPFASMSARYQSVGPGPFFSTPTTPVLPIPVVTVKPSFFSSAATMPAVRVSVKASSGWRVQVLERRLEPRRVGRNHGLDLVDQGL